MRNILGTPFNYCNNPNEWINDNLNELMAFPARLSPNIKYYNYFRELYVLLFVPATETECQVEKTWQCTQFRCL